MERREKQYWTAKFYGVNEENERQFVGKIMKAKHSKFDELQKESADFIIREAWKIEANNFNCIRPLN